jgi:hypothetical protein
MKEEVILRIGARIIKIGVTVMKIWALEAFWGKTGFSRGFWDFF